MIWYSSHYGFSSLVQIGLQHDDGRKRGETLSQSEIEKRLEDMWKEIEREDTKESNKKKMF